MKAKKKLKIQKNKSFVENLKDFFEDNEFEYTVDDVNDYDEDVKVVYTKYEAQNNSDMYMLTGQDAVWAYFYNEIEIDNNGKEYVSRHGGKPGFYYHNSGVFVDFDTNIDHCEKLFGWTKEQNKDMADLWVNEMMDDFKIHKPKIFKIGFSQAIIDNLVGRGYFSEVNYTIDELIELSDILKDDRIFSKEAKDIFLF